MTKQMKKIGKMKVRWYHAIEEMTVYESWTGVLCIRRQDIRPTHRGGTGGQCYYKLRRNPKAGQSVVASKSVKHSAGVKMVEPKWHTNHGKVYEPPMTSEQKQKSKTKKERKQSRREKLLDKLLTHLTKAERKQLLGPKARFSREELGL